MTATDLPYGNYGYHCDGCDVGVRIGDRVPSVDTF